MNQYEVTFIVDPVLSGDEIKATAQTYVEALENEGNKIVHMDEMGLRQLAYPINKRTSGVYYCIEFQTDKGSIIERLELALYRDERIMRFLTVKLDKYGVKYNEDKRAGKIGKAKRTLEREKKAASKKDTKKSSGRSKKQTEKPAAKKATTKKATSGKPATLPKVEKPSPEEE